MNAKSIDAIIDMVANFNYNINTKATDKNNISIEVKRPDFLIKNRDKNLEELLQIISNLKGSIISKTNTRESKINELYELIKIKLNKDLSLFNLKIVTKFIKGYTSTDSDKLDKSIKVLFDIILKEVEGELKKILPNFDLLPNLFYNTEKLKEIINSVSGRRASQEENSESVKSLMYIYIHTILKNRSLADFDKQLFIFERILAVHIAEFEQKDKYKFLLKSLPEALLHDDPKSKIRSSIYLYFTSYINELEQKVNYLSNTLNTNQIINSELSNRVNQLSKQGSEKDSLITHLTEEGKERNEIINKLQTELTTTNNLHNYEINIYKMQLQNLETGIIERLQKNIQLDLDGLTGFANRLSQDDSLILRMYITRIHQLLNTL